jgi:hypothetical protein
MQCGPMRYRVDAKSQAATRPFSHKVTIRETGFRLAPDLESQSLMQITAIYAALAKDEKRNDQSEPRSRPPAGDPDGAP